MATSGHWRHTTTAVIIALVAGGCPPQPGDGGFIPVAPAGPAEYLGSATCQTCHGNLAGSFQLHGHAHILQRTEGIAPAYPAAAWRAGVLEPPPGYEYAEIDYVIGGYRKAANFVDRQGRLLTGENARFRLANGPAGGESGFGPFGADPPGVSYGYDCFRCHVTGGEPVELNGGRRQGNRPGIGGTWAEEGVGCEACHGPGSRHVPAPTAGEILARPGIETCARCHTAAESRGELVARGGLLAGGQQYTELLHSPHASFACTTCHDPHASPTYERERAIRNPCAACHGEMNMALHRGRVFVLGDYVEELRCESCHMPFASTYASASAFDVRGTPVVVGDTRTHLFRIDARENAVLVDGTGRVVLDAAGRAAVPAAYVCLRCHNQRGNAFELSFRSAAEIADGIHAIQGPSR